MAFYYFTTFPLSLKPANSLVSSSASTVAASVLSGFSNYTPSKRINISDLGFHRLPTSSSIPSFDMSASGSSATTPSKKRRATTLLPPFEPLSSSPALPRPLKRQYRGGFDYPTPDPTSTVDVLSSSPPGIISSGRLGQTLPRLPPQSRSQQQQQPRTQPSVPRPIKASERSPLSTVPYVELPIDGKIIRMGRSSVSSDFQLSTNKHVSRVHIEARYIAPSTVLEPPRIEIICKGWNDLNVHCAGRSYTLHRGDSFMSEEESSQVLLVVQDARVFVLWPKREVRSVCQADGETESEAEADADAHGAENGSDWEASPSPAARRQHALKKHLQSVAGPEIASSPFREASRMRSPMSPSPSSASALSSSARLQALLPVTETRQLVSLTGEEEDANEEVQIYEDEPELPPPHADTADEEELEADATIMPAYTSAATLHDTFSSDLSDPGSDAGNDHDENSSMLHSFAIFSDDIDDRFTEYAQDKHEKKKQQHQRRRLPPVPEELFAPSEADVETSRALYAPEMVPAVSDASPRKKSPSPKAEERDVEKTREQEPESDKEEEPVPFAEEIAHQSIDQLAFSRLSSTPLSTLMSNLPGDLRVGLTKDTFKRVLESVQCIGIIPRHGKDAAGKALESEYYYVPEADDNIARKAVVDGMRKPSLRACRKQHKQYYWKRPKTP
ncbi:hypothetical protein TD95_001471 [Thielaviopsis punctulata]|uniref:FHA domain-containing protein n=1 Tax=Thielaviopsis punctulata TaxID=72032 RepID=A0A0F4ZH22_9PEZI|nr:hypothetical protein TD95_001471 [Thielaviopsis punctulata]